MENLDIVKQLVKEAIEEGMKGYRGSKGIQSARTWANFDKFHNMDSRQATKLFKSAKPGIQAIINKYPLNLPQGEKIPLEVAYDTFLNFANSISEDEAALKELGINPRQLKKDCNDIEKYFSYSKITPQEMNMDASTKFNLGVVYSPINQKPAVAPVNESRIRKAVSESLDKFLNEYFG